MTATQLREFESVFMGIVGEVLAGYGYEHDRSHSRPRGVALEFTHKEHRLFAVCEGGTVILDLILQEEPDRYWRVSVNQALWFAGVDAVSKKAPLPEKLAFFASELSRCSDLLEGCIAAPDPRYCFSMSTCELEDYLAAQRGR